LIDPYYLQKTIGYDPMGPTQKADELIEMTRDLPARWTREDTDRDKALEVIAEEDKEEGAARIEEENFDDLIGALGDDKGEDENMDEEEEEVDDEEDKEDDEEVRDDEGAGMEY
jgi:hypothetical protein